MHRFSGPDRLLAVLILALAGVALLVLVGPVVIVLITFVRDNLPSSDDIQWLLHGGGGSCR